MEKYQRGKVYAIICRKTGKRYVGSTCEPTLAKRLAKHVNDFKLEKKCITSYHIIKNGDYYIILLESYPCNSRDELRMCEQKHIDACECVNKQKAFQSHEERLEKYKQYNEEHRDEIAEQRKQHYEQNRDKLIEIQKQYREQNRDEINAKKREKVPCPQCQKEMNKNHITRHLKICKVKLLQDVENPL